MIVRGFLWVHCLFWAFWVGFGWGVGRILQKKSHFNPIPTTFFAVFDQFFVILSHFGSKNKQFWPILSHFRVNWSFHVYYWICSILFCGNLLSKSWFIVAWSTFQDFFLAAFLQTFQLSSYNECRRKWIRHHITILVWIREILYQNQSKLQEASIHRLFDLFGGKPTLVLIRDF